MGGGTATRSDGQMEGPCQRDSRQVVLSDLESLWLAWAPGSGDPMVRTGGLDARSCRCRGDRRFACTAGWPRTIARCRHANRAGAAGCPGAAPQRDTLRGGRVGAAALGGAAAQRPGTVRRLAHHHRGRGLLPGDEGHSQRPARRRGRAQRRRQVPLPGELTGERGGFADDYDFVFIHDPQPAALLGFSGKGSARWIWRSHIDTSPPNPGVWKFLRPFLAEYDASIFTMGEFVPADLPTPYRGDHPARRSTR